MSGKGPDVARELAEIEAIRQLKARYFRFIDTGDWESLADLFTEDLHFEMDGIEMHGPREFVATLQETLGGAATVHQGHSPEIELLDADRARGVWGMFDYLAWPDSDGNGEQGLKGYGHYREEYRRGADGWRIRSSVLTRLKIDLLPGGLPPHLRQA